MQITQVLFCSRNKQLYFFRALKMWKVVVSTIPIFVRPRHPLSLSLSLSLHLTHSDAVPSRRRHPPQFKLTREMADLIGGGEHYRWFVDLCVRGFLAVRAHCEDVMAAAALMSRRCAVRGGQFGHVPPPPPLPVAVFRFSPPNTMGKSALVLSISSCCVVALPESKWSEHCCSQFNYSRMIV